MYVTICSLIWAYLLTGILIDILNFFGMVTNLSSAYLGMTIIALGNSIPDALVTRLIAQQGHAQMAIEGV